MQFILKGRWRVVVIPKLVGMLQLPSVVPEFPNLYPHGNVVLNGPPGGPVVLCPQGLTEGHARYDRHPKKRRRTGRPVIHSSTSKEGRIEPNELGKLFPHATSFGCGRSITAKSRSLRSNFRT